MNSEFKRCADDALHALHRKLASAGDDFGFETELDSGTLTIHFEGGQSPVIVSSQPAGYIRVSAGAKQHKFVWDVVENAFTMDSTGQTLQELIEETVSRTVGDDVSL